MTQWPPERLQRTPRGPTHGPRRPYGLAWAAVATWGDGLTCDPTAPFDRVDPGDSTGSGDALACGDAMRCGVPWAFGILRYPGP